MESGSHKFLPMQMFMGNGRHTLLPMKMSNWKRTS